MGLKISDYKIKGFGLTVPEAYARLTNVHIDVVGRAYGTFEIYQHRDDIENCQPLERHDINTIIDKKESVHKQLYLKAKEQLFADWEDDIVDDEVYSIAEEIG